MSIIAAYLFYLRFPNNFLEPNFYAEDGATFYETLHEKGLLGALVTPFSGYSVVGIYLLEQAGDIINALFFNNEFVNVARSLSLVSYGFLGMLCALPIVLFRRLLKPRYLLLAAYVMLIFVPLPGFDYAIIGTIGNLKFAFVFLAFILLIYRNYLPLMSRKVILVDLLLLVCAYTNVTVYLLLPFGFLRYFSSFKKRRYKEVFTSTSFASLAVLGLLLVPQIVMVMLHGVTENVGYLDSPYQPQRTVELFLWRTLLYPFFYFIEHPSDVLVIILFVILMIAPFAVIKSHRKIYLFAIYASLVTSGLFIFKRTGVSELFTGYQSSGPDQFFYAQNLIIILGVVFAISALEKRLRSFWIVAAGGCITLTIFIIGYIPVAGSYGQSDFMERNVGNIYENANNLCRSAAKDLTLATYPDKSQNYTQLSREELCTNTAISYPRIVALGLEPDGNSYVAGLGVNKVTQTFRSPQKGLSGVAVYFSTFSAQVTSPYEILLYDATCQKIIHRVPLDEARIKDNRYYTATFSTLNDSENKTYCFTVVPEKGSLSESPLAVQLSQSEAYQDGATVINGQTLVRDVVFKLQYK